MKSIKTKFDNIRDKNDDKMPIPKRNYVLCLIGILVIIIGMILMAGGGEATPTEFHYEIYSFRRITLAPILIILGFAFEIYAIMRR